MSETTPTPTKPPAAAAEKLARRAARRRRIADTPANRDLNAIVAAAGGLRRLLEGFLAEHRRRCRCDWCRLEAHARYVREDARGLLWVLEHGAGMIECNIVPVDDPPADTDPAEPAAVVVTTPTATDR